MQKQYKIYKMDIDSIDETLSKLEKYNVIRISEQYIAVEYDYMDNSYKELLDYMFYLPVSQYIFMASSYYRLISFLVKNKYRIYEVRLNAILDDENKEIQKYINKLQKEDTPGVLDKLLQELHWYNFDEGIDICNLSFGRKINNVFCQAHIANNGVVFVDNSSFQTDVVSILGSIL